MRCLKMIAATDDDGAPDLGQFTNPTTSNSNSFIALGVIRNGGRGIRELV